MPQKQMHERQVCRRFEYMAADLTLELAIHFENDVMVRHSVSGAFSQERPPVRLKHLSCEKSFRNYNEAVAEFNKRVKEIL